MKFNPRSLVYTLAAHALLLALLLLATCSTGKNEDMQPIEGIPVQLGYADATGGMEIEPIEPATPAKELPSATPATKPTVKAPAAKPVITQTDKSTPVPKPAIDAKKKEEAEQARLEQEARERAAQAAREEEERKRAAARATVAGKFNQGSPQGNATAGATTGISGYGTASVSGRALTGTLPRPAYPNNEQGTVVVQVTVNAAGRVTTATVRTSGTNTANSALRNAALAAARQALFNAQEGATDQIGTITYNFILR